jgi:hypothetical protein
MLAVCVKLTKRSLGAAVLLHELAHELSTKPTKQGPFGEIAPTVKRTIQDWAAVTGLSADQVSRALALLRDLGLVACTYSGGLTITLTTQSQAALSESS